MGLVLERGVGEVIELYVKPGTDPAELAAALARGLTIQIHKIEPGKRKAWLNINAPDEISIVRRELIQQSDGIG